MTGESDRGSGSQNGGFESSPETTDMPVEAEGIYEIRVKSHLDEHWSGRFGNLRISHDSEGNTRLVGPITDQAALHGILLQFRDLGLTLISLTRLTPDADGVQEE